MISNYRKSKHPGGTVIKLNIPETWGVDRSTPNSLTPRIDMSIYTIAVNIV